MFSKLGSLPIWQKLSLIAIVMALPIGALVFLYVESRNEQIAFTETELSGLEYIGPLRQILEAVPEHRDTALAVLAGDDTFAAQHKESKTKVEAALAAVDQADRRSGAALEASQKWNSIKSAWRNLDSQDLKLSPRDTFTKHTALVDEVLQLMRLVSDKSNLTTDPVLDSYYLIDTLVNGIGISAEFTSQLRGTASAALVRGTVTPEEAAQVAMLTRQLAGSAQYVERGVESAIRYNPRLKGTVEVHAKEAGRQALELVRTTQSDPLRSGDSARPYYQQASKVSAAYLNLFDSTTKSLNGMLRTRIEGLNEQKYQQLGLVLAALLIAAFLVLWVSRTIMRQVNSMYTMVARINKGDLSARSEILSSDELGQMAESFNFMMDNTVTLVQSRDERDQIQKSIMKLLDEVSGVASGDLTTEAEVTGDVTGAIADSFNYMIQELRGIISSVQHTTAEVTTSASQVQRTAAQLADGSRKQAKQIAEASAAISGMARSIQQVSSSAAEAASVTGQALESARGGAESVRSTINGMNSIRTQVQETSKRIKRLGESSQEIGEIVELIGDIADRTSILALNASIQAAMAGDAGRGFGVVAEEVERLADRAAESTKKITALIKSVQADTTEAIAAMEETTREVVGGSQLANEAGQRLKDIEEVSKRIADVVERIAQASKLQAAGSDAVSRNVEDITRFTVETASGAETAEASVRQLASLAANLSKSLEHFKLPQAA